MTENELYHMSKADLIEIIYQMKKNEERLKAQLSEAENRPEKQVVRYSDNGSIAEAAIEISGVLNAAQAAADEYLRQLKAKYSGIEIRCESMLAESEEKCKQKEQETDRRINAKWALFNKKVQEYMQTKNELSDLLK